MTVPSFASLCQEYLTLWAHMIINPARLASVKQVAAARFANKARYVAASILCGYPWFVLALIHTMEANGNFHGHLHNGDPLTARTTHVPAGRPPTGSPPFTWEESAADAIAFEKRENPAVFDHIPSWDIARVCYVLEAYNGEGTRAHGKHTPYLWSWTNDFTGGKYVADHVWDPSADSSQPGAMAVLKELMALDPTISTDLNAVARQEGTEGPTTPTLPKPQPIPQTQPPARARSLFQVIWDILVAIFRRKS